MVEITNIQIPNTDPNDGLVVTVGNIQDYGINLWLGVIQTPQSDFESLNFVTEEIFDTQYLYRVIAFDNDEADGTEEVDVTDVPQWSDNDTAQSPLTVVLFDRDDGEVYDFGGFAEGDSVASNETNSLIDRNFVGFDHDSLPAVDLDFSRKSSDKSVQPEAVVDVLNDGQWVRMPITQTETRINKDGVADITRTARVDCPVTWGVQPDGESKVQIYEYVGASEKEENPEFDSARVYYWNDYIEQYQIVHFGYVASIGPAAENGTFRFYVYDASDLMKNINVTKTYDEPTAPQVARYVGSTVDADTPINVRDAITTTVGRQDVTVLAEEPLPEIADPIENEGSIESFSGDVAGWLNETTPITITEEGATGLGDSLNVSAWLDDALHAGGHKHFRRNRHTLANVMNWLTDEIGGSWWFKPFENGVDLVVNNGVTDGFDIARTSYYDGNFDPDELDYVLGENLAAVDVLNNTSLEDLKPINFLELKGETANSFLGQNVDAVDLDGPIGASRGQTNKYPHVQVRYPPLLERTGGKRLGPNPIDSGVQTEEEAKKEAVKQFKQQHEDSTSGSMEVKSLPSIRPYDYMAAVPVCNDTFDSEMNPIQYEVNSIQHQTKPEERYTTLLGVSMAINEDLIDVESSMEELNTNEE